MQSHPAHDAVREHVRERELTLTSHSLAETYSVLTRLPADARLDPSDAASLIEARFAGPLVALAAHDASVPLLTRDRRALSTYAILGAECEVVAEGRD